MGENGGGPHAMQEEPISGGGMPLTSVKTCYVVETSSSEGLSFPNTQVLVSAPSGPQ